MTAGPEEPFDEQTVADPYIIPERPIALVTAALVKAQANFSTVPKSGLNPHYKSRYAKLDDIIEMVKPHLGAAGLCISHSTLYTTDGWQLRTRLYHTSGQYLEGFLPLTPEIGRASCRERV